MKLDRTVTDVHAVLLIAARAGLKARYVSPSLDAISEGSEVPVPSVVWALHPIFPNPPDFYPAFRFELQTMHRQPTNAPRCKEEPYKRIAPFRPVTESVAAES